MSKSRQNNGTGRRRERAEGARARLQGRINDLLAMGKQAEAVERSKEIANINRKWGVP